MTIKGKLITLLMATLFNSPFAMTQENTQYKYETFKGDPLKAQIYTLDNGLKIFLSVYKDAPRIQTYVAVHTGSKMDPPETTGLAHYFEHMMFKGTESFGTTDWSKEKVLIRQIEDQFEIYRKEKDETKRAAIYHQIDTLSYQASLLAIPNEYDKMMDAIGSQGSNAGTSNDYTIYMENIPSNQLENWAMIQADRFSKPVLRLFHTELETVYEEKNMSLTNDNRKVSEALLKALFPNHPYGTQTTLGETEHLKNPSMKNIRDFFAKYYVPNNMAICMSGDFDPDSVVKVIDKYFGKLPSSPVPPLQYGPFRPLTAPITREITGLEAENLRIAYGFDMKANDNQTLLLTMIATMLSNGKAGLIDLNLNQKQKVLSANAYDNQYADYGMLVLSGKPKTGQKLEDVKDLLLAEIEHLKKGDFPTWMLEAAVNNTRLELLKQFETNQGRAMAMANSYLNDVPYEQNVTYLEDLKKITKKDIVDFAGKYLQNNYVIVYKRQGKPEEADKIKKPPITPVHINRDEESSFSKKVKAAKVAAEEPEFLDYTKDLATLTLGKRTRVLYKENTENATFSLYYFFRMGRNNDKVMSFATAYLPFLGTSQHSAEQLKQEFYRLGCSFTANSNEEETTLSLSGLSENFEKALSLAEELLNDPKADSAALANLVSNTLKTRKDGMSNQNENFSALVSYGIYGSDSPYKNLLTAAELKSLKPEQLTAKIRELIGFEHEILYYGPDMRETVTTLLGIHHKFAEKPVRVPEPKLFPAMETTSNQVLFADYDAKQSKIQSINRQGKYEPALVPELTLYNNYFGSNIVFQELREKRALAYTAYSRFQEPNQKYKPFLSIGYIATQNDKISDALTAFNELYNDMPASDITFNVSRNAVIEKIRTERIRRTAVLWNFINSEKLGLNHDIRIDVYKKVQKMTLADMKAFNEKYIKNQPKTYVILGKEKDIDFKALEKFGSVKKLSLKDIFGE